MLKPGLTRKITGTLIIISVLAVIASMFFMWVMTRQQFIDYIQENNRTVLEQWKPEILDYCQQFGFEGLQDYLLTNGSGMGMRQHRRGQVMSMGMGSGRRLIVSNNSGLVVADTGKTMLGQSADFKNIPTSSDKLILYGQQLGTLYVISPLASGLASLENEFVNKLTISTGVFALLIGLIALISGLLLGNRISSPIQELSDGIHQLAQGNLDKRIILKGDQEFINLGSDFNLMAQKLQDTEKLRRRLTADIAHELRTPLAFIRGQVEGMQSASIPMNSENLSLVQDEVIRLSRLVKDLETLALMESHALPLNQTTFPNSDLLERLMPVNIAMQDKGINFNINIDKEVSAIRADQDRLLQILLNLLANCLHHVQTGGTVSLSIQKQNDSLKFSVADNGPGISAENLLHIFDRFYRVDNSRNRHEGGMGLGLAIAKGYVEAHGGKIWAESTLGQGTTFYFLIPQ